MHLALTFMVAAATPVAAPKTCELTIELVDAGSGREVPGLVHVEDAGGKNLVFERLLSRGQGLDPTHAAARWSVLPKRSTQKAPCARLAIEAFAGIETELARAEVDLTAKTEATVSISLHRFSNLKDKGWISANTHLHLKQLSRKQADRYLREIPAADGLDLVFPSYLERADVDRDYVSNGYSDIDLQELSQAAGLQFGSGEEQRQNLTPFGEGYGHVLFLNLHKLVRPVSIGPAIMNHGTDGTPLQMGIEKAREQGATVLWCHNAQGLEGAANWILGKPQALNIFDGDPEKWGSYEDTYYRYLNVGLRVPFSTGTDWFIYDFSRVYVRATASQTPDTFLTQLAGGRTFITNGPLLEFGVDDKGIGDTIKLQSAATVRVQGRAVGRVDFRVLQVVRNGRVIESVPSHQEGNVFVANLNTEMAIPEASWVAMRVAPPTATDTHSATIAKTELGGALFAHTSPIFIDVGGKKVFDLTVAKSLYEQIKAARLTVTSKAVFGSDKERQDVLGVYSQALAKIELWLRASHPPELPR